MYKPGSVSSQLHLSVQKGAKASSISQRYIVTAINDTSRFAFSYDASYLWRDIASDSYSFRLMEGVIASDRYRSGNVRAVINTKSYRIDLTRTHSDTVTYNGVYISAETFPTTDVATTQRW